MGLAKSSVLPRRPVVDAAPPATIQGTDFDPPPRGDPRWPRVRGYDITALVGSGGMGIVYKARHAELRRTVALKMLRGGVLADREYRDRFRAEAEAVARLQHPNIIQVFEVGTIEPLPGEVHPSPFIALEFVDGGCLTDRTERPQPPRYAAAMVEKLARAVDSAHRVGVIHRDLKPANVLLTREGEPKIADFGVAKQLETERDAGGRFLTQDGTVVGTPEYMAPEQARGDAATTAVDIYALGVLLYELLTARVPFQGASPVETMTQVQCQDAPSPRQFHASVPRDLETICLKCVEKDPSKRYETAAALADDLRCYLDNRPIRARRITEVEKIWRWCRRNPMVAASVAGVIGVFLISFLLVTRSYWKADAALREEAKQREEAQAKERAERWERYRANIVATASALQVYNIDTARRTLDAAPDEYRNWEWRHFHSRLDLSSQTLRCGSGTATHAALTKDGRRIVVPGEEGLAHVWDVNAAKELHSFRHGPEFWSGNFSTDGKLASYPGPDHSVIIHEIDTNRIRHTLRGHTAGIHTRLFNADATRLVTAATDGTIRVWDVATGQQLRLFRPYPTNIAGTYFSPDGRRIVTANELHKDVKLLDADTGKLVADLPGHQVSLYNNFFSPTGDRFVTTEGFPCNSMKLWDAATGALIADMKGHSNTITDLAFSLDGRRIASSSTDQTLRLWDAATGKPIAVLKGHSGRLTSVAFSRDSKRLVSGSQDHTARLWDADGGAPLGVLNGHANWVTHVGFSADGQRVVTASTDGTVRFWDPRLAEDNGILRGHTSFAYSVAFHPDGRRVASSGWDGTVRVWDSTTGEQKLLLDHGPNVIVGSVAIQRGGKLLASRSRAALYLWDLATGQQVHRWEAPTDTWRDPRLAFSPDGSLLATGCRGAVVKLFDVATRREVAVLRGHIDEIRDVAFSPDGKWLASAGEFGDRTVRIWDVTKREPIAVLEGHKDCVYAAAFSPDGALLATGSIDGTTRLWDTATWREIEQLKHGSNVYGLAFTPDGTRLACGGADNSIRLWDVATRQSVAELRGHTDYVHQVAFSPDGTRLASASGDFTLRIWDTVRPQDRGRDR